MIPMLANQIRIYRSTLYYVVVMLIVLFLFYHARTVQVVDAADFASDLPAFVCPLISLH